MDEVVHEILCRREFAAAIAPGAGRRLPCSERCLVQRDSERASTTRCRHRYASAPSRSGHARNVSKVGEFSLDQCGRAAVRLPSDVRHVHYTPGAQDERPQIYRVRIPPYVWRDPVRFAFIEASSTGEACTRVANATRAFDTCPRSDLLQRVSATSHEDCLRRGVSDDLELRLFEVAWRDGVIIAWVEQPIFLLRAPGALTLKWASLDRLDH